MLLKYIYAYVRQFIKVYTFTVYEIIEYLIIKYIEKLKYCGYQDYHGVCMTVIYIIKILNFCVIRMCLCACARVLCISFYTYTYIERYVCYYKFYIEIFRSLLVQFCYPRY